MRSLAEVLWGAILGTFLGLAITAAFVYYATHHPNPNDPQKGWALPLVGVVLVPLCASAGVLRAILKDAKRRDEE